MLDLDGVKGICALMDREFGNVTYNAEDGIWMIFDEPSNSFITNISEREKLDSFSAESGQVQSKRVRLVFNEEEAKGIFDVAPNDSGWLEHFMLDLKKNIRPPSLLQRFGGFPIPLLLVAGGSALVVPIKQPYCRISIKSRQPNQRIRGIADNVVANMLYDLLKVAVGAVLLLVAAWVLEQFGIDIFKLLRISNGS